MKTELDQLIENAFKSEGATADVNKVYLQLLKSDLTIPVEHHAESGTEDEPYTPLFSIEDDFIFIAAFDALDKFRTWAGNAFDEIEHITLKGQELINNIGEKVFLALNPGTATYKEFSPEEIQRLKTIVNKIEVLKNNANK